MLPASVAVIPIATMITAKINPLIVFIFWPKFKQKSEYGLVFDEKISIQKCILILSLSYLPQLIRILI